MLPEVGSRRFSTIFATVDLPEPDSPTSARAEQRRRSNETLSTALNSCFLPREARTLNSLVRLRTETTATSDCSSAPPAISSEHSLLSLRASRLRDDASDGAAATKRLV